MTDPVQASIRLARPDEARLLQEICSRADQAYVDVGLPQLAADLFPVDLLERAISRERVVVATDGSRDVPIGWLLISFGGPEPCIAQVAVEPAHGRRGIGSALLEVAVKRLRSEGFETIVLNTERDVPWNAPWYARFGFVEVSEPEWTDDMRVIVEEQLADGLDWNSRVHMRLDLGR